MVSLDSTKTTREIETDVSCGEYMGCPEEPHRLVRQGAGRESQEAWSTYLCQGPWMECFGVPLAKDGSVDSKQKKR